MKRTASLFLIVLMANQVFSQSGKVLDNLSMESKILKMERKYAIYLPPDYEYSQRSYPVLYLLHGAGDDQTGWIQFGEVLLIADKAILEGISTAMIIAMPDANTGKRGYVNSPDGEWRYEDFFFEEFMPYIENTYRIKQEKRYRGIAGLSMGGGGTFYYALHRPDLFAAACPLSASPGPLSRDETSKWMERLGSNFKNTGSEEFYNQYSVIQLLENLPEEKIKSVRWFIDCGDDDFLYEGNSLIHILMRKRNIPHEFRIRDGGHTWTYWRESLPEVLKFVSMSFHQY